MNATQLTNDPDFRQLVRDTERLMPQISTRLASREAEQDAKKSIQTFNTLEKEFRKLQGALASFPNKLTPQQKEQLEGHKRELANLQTGAGKELGLSRKEFSLLVSDLSKRSTKLMERHAELAKAPENTRQTVLADAAKPVLSRSMRVSPLAFASSESDVETALGTPKLTSQETCVALCAGEYAAALAIASGIYIAASATCGGLLAVPVVGPFLAAACVGGASVTYAGAGAAAMAVYTKCVLECE